LRNDLSSASSDLGEGGGQAAKTDPRTPEERSTGTFWGKIVMGNSSRLTTFLQPSECETLLSALPPSQPHGTARTWSASQAAQLIRDPTFYSFNLLWIFHSIGGWGISLVLPTVIYELRIPNTNSATTQLMTMPTYTFGCAFMCFFGWLIHRQKLGPWVVCIGLEAVIVGCYIVLLTVKVPVIKYIFVTLATACVSCVYPLMWPERIRAAKGTTGAGLGIGITNACAQLSGIVGPQLYQTRFGPRYVMSFSVSVGMLACSVVMMVITWWIVRSRDRKVKEASDIGEGGVNEEIIDDVVRR
jgi:hypothetical protein